MYAMPRTSWTLKQKMLLKSRYRLILTWGLFTGVNYSRTPVRFAICIYLGLKVFILHTSSINMRSVNVPVRRVKPETRFGSLPDGEVADGVTLEWNPDDFNSDPSARFPMGC
jgi:hypothetical protein